MTPAPEADRRRITLLATGGTIACVSGTDGRMVPRLTPDEPVASVRAGHLNGPKARLAMMVGLNETSTTAELQAWLSDIG